MVIDWQASKVHWVSEVEARLVPRLLADGRFVDGPELIARFRAAVERWRGGGDIRYMIHDANELAAAAALLDVLGPADLLRYEPRLAGTLKKIDFILQAADGSRSWVECQDGRARMAGRRRFLAAVRGDRSRVSG
jgi:hypothetical protein